MIEIGPESKRSLDVDCYGRVHRSVLLEVLPMTPADLLATYTRLREQAMRLGPMGNAELFVFLQDNLDALLSAVRQQAITEERECCALAVEQHARALCSQFDGPDHFCEISCGCYEELAAALRAGGTP